MPQPAFNILTLDFRESKSEDLFRHGQHARHDSFHSEIFRHDVLIDREPFFHGKVIVEASIPEEGLLLIPT